jgi:hypothetical protein
MNFSTHSLALLSAAASLLFASAAMGQTLLTTSPYTDISEQTDISAYLRSADAVPTSHGANTSSVTQNGNLNTANANMTAMSGGSYFGNTTTQIQTGGDNNISTINAVGNSNMLTTTQTGNTNNAIITAYGSNNSYSTTQTGNGLSVNLTQVGNGKSVSITQTGSK